MASQTNSQGKTIEVLIAEDSATQAEQLKYLLEENGYIVTTAANGKLGLEAARRQKPTLIISDVVMPEMDGYAFCKAVKTDEHLKDIPVIIVTSLSSLQDIAMGLECGADNFIRKPYDPKALLSRIGYILANRELRSSNSTRMGLEIYLGGKKHFITSEREQILDLLISTYEQAMEVNEELKLREKEIKTLNADLEQRASELEAANKELESFSYSVSHDLRSPLRAIDGFSKMLMEDHGDMLNEAGRRLLRKIGENVTRMGQLIDDLLQFSRLGRQPITAHAIDMTSLAQEVFNELAVIGEGISRKCLFEPLPVGWGDQSLIRQVWFNLLSNAIKYTGVQANPRIQVSGQREGSETIYCVGDNGAGFNMKYYDKLFGVFQRLHTNDEFPGTGVGLATVRRVVVRHGGRVWAEGKVGEGAKFYFTLPAVKEDVL